MNRYNKMLEVVVDRCGLALKVQFSHKKGRQLSPKLNNSFIV